MLKACIFDLDGTLAYTLDSMACVANEILEEMGFEALPVDNYRYYCGDGASMLVRRCLIDAGDSELEHFEEMDRIYRERFNADPLYRVSVFTGIKELLGALKEKGIFLGVCSNKPHEASVKVIQDLFGDSVFDYVIGQREGIRRKPAPDGALFLAGQFGVSPEECLYIGDTGTDMQTGNSAGMNTAGVLWGYRDKKELMENHAKFIAEKPEDILQILEDRIRIIFSDLDGTLLRNGAQTLPEQIFPLIRSLKEKNILFVAASGRQYANMRRMFEPVKDDIIYICENGALAVYEGQLLYKEPFPEDLCRDIYKAAMEKTDTEFLYSGASHHYLIPKSPEFVDFLKNVVRNDYKCVSGLSEIPEECVKCAVFETGGVTEGDMNYWEERFGSRCEVATSGNGWIDFIPFGINKGYGLRRMCERLGVSPSVSMAFGDELNDIDMLESAGFGVAMSHAADAVKKSAGYETASEEEVIEALLRSEGRLNKEVMACIQKKR